MNSKHSHTARCSREGLDKDWYQTFENCLLKMVNSQGKNLRPFPFIRTVKEVIKAHREGEQEDAHEYLVNLLERLHKHAMDAYQQIYTLDKEWMKKNRHLELTSSINQIFAGIIRSQVLCKNCGNASDTYDPFTDLSLELNECQSVSDCFQQFTKVLSICTNVAWMYSLTFSFSQIQTKHSSSNGSSLVWCGLSKPSLIIPSPSSCDNSSLVVREHEVTRVRLHEFANSSLVTG